MWFQVLFISLRYGCYDSTYGLVMKRYRPKNGSNGFVRPEIHRNWRWPPLQLIFVSFLKCVNRFINSPCHRRKNVSRIKIEFCGEEQVKRWVWRRNRIFAKNTIRLCRWSCRCFCSLTPKIARFGRFCSILNLDRFNSMGSAVVLPTNLRIDNVQRR